MIDTRVWSEAERKQAAAMVGLAESGSTTDSPDGFEVLVLQEEADTCYVTTAINLQCELNALRKEVEEAQHLLLGADLLGELGEDDWLKQRAEWLARNSSASQPKEPQ